MAVSKHCSKHVYHQMIKVRYQCLGTKLVSTHKLGGFLFYPQAGRVPTKHLARQDSRYTHKLGGFLLHPQAGRVPSQHPDLLDPTSHKIS